MENLERTGLVAALRERIEAGRPTLAVCLGLQLLAEGSEESPGVAGLGVLPVRAERFPAGALRVPHLGWNRIVPDREGGLLDEGYAYFAHTFRVTDVPAGWTAARCEYGAPFVAALERGAVLACQFHPELSGAFGRDLLRRWLAQSPEESAVSC
jgi:imidazole glycerol phosphate synthase glutamine amidotransferase subunit